ncbi:MAG TPA: helix-turn-helix transcriptional regulator [Candidatus Acidoferrum sp.]|jgi:transcriptional regulator with XRE-family HTH domain|nr:helix-turn-helix transcriptional regulator [Candidatus Acidoferrum sp.]
MERAGEKLKRTREKLRLTYRDVERASHMLAKRRANDEFGIALSRLADIEHKGTVPTIFRLYSLCVIYRLDLWEVLGWYGVPADSLAADIFQTPLPGTHPVDIQPHAPIPVPQPMDAEFDPRRTTFLNHLVRRWGKAGLGLLSGLDLRHHRYGLIGTEDWSMYPLLHPGTLLLIDEGRRRIVSKGWTSLADRPIYFLETRAGYRCGWCSGSAGKLVFQPHPASLQPPDVYQSTDVDIIGQVTGVAMRLERRTSPDRS